MAVFQVVTTLMCTLLLLHRANGQIAAISISLPHIISLLENVTETLSPSVPQVAALLKNQQNTQMITNDKIENMTNVMGTLLERNNQEPENITQQLAIQNLMMTSVLNPVVGLLQRHDQLLDNITDQLGLQNQILATMTTLLQKQTERIQRQAIAQDCNDILDQGFNQNYGTYTIKPKDKLVSFEVVCDLITEGGGWIVFQKRFDGSEDFYRPWNDYKNGFGDMSEEHWLGLDKIHRLTRNGVWQLRVELEEFSGNTSFAQYVNFAIGDEASNYRLIVGEYSGTAEHVLVIHTNTTFSTYDQDHDEFSSNCAEECETAWWFVSCNGSNLNGPYPESSQILGRGMAWEDGKKALKVSEMKMRRVYDSIECEDTNSAPVQPATTLATIAPTTVSTTKLVSTTTSPIPIGQYCQYVLDQGFTGNYGIYRIQPSIDTEFFEVVCDLETNGKGWIVFQRRFDGSEEFYLPWMDYKKGFGNLTGENWLGLEKLHRLTRSGVWQLRVDLEDFSDNTAYAEYSNFSIGDESTNYRLSIGDYSGTAGDSLTYYQSNMAFSTYDQDHDTTSGNCAHSWQGAWWYKNCAKSNLNGLYKGAPVNDHKGMVWYQWKNRYEALKKSEMKIKRI